MRSRLIIIGVLIGCSLLTGCGEWLDVQPYDKISEDELYSTEDGFKKLLNGVYLGLNDDELYGAALTVEMIEVMGGAYTIGSDNSVWGNFKDLSDYKYETEYWRGRLSETWNKAYTLILNCNEIIENMESRQGIFTGDNYNIIRGEALALRAMLHFDMLRLFGPVYSKDKTKLSIPYYTRQTNQPEDRLTAEEVANKVISDLEEARILLANDPVKTNGTMMSGDDSGTGSSANFLRYRALRMNYYAATALLARICLYAASDDDTDGSMRTKAFSTATEVIKAVDSNIFPFVDKSLVTGSPDDTDRIFSSEVIFALSDANRNTIFKNYFDPTRMPNYVFRMDNDLMANRIYGGTNTGGNQDDYRYRVNWVASGSNRYFYKYSDMNDVSKIENTMIPMLRTGEMYLIAAESQSKSLASGVSYVNTLRRNRGVSNLSSLTQDLLVNEYIRELYGEGQLFYLYKRLYTSIIFSDRASKNIPPSDEVFVVPLPDSETEN